MNGTQITRRSAIAALALVIPAPSIAAFVSFWLPSFWLARGEAALVVYALCKAVLYGTPALWCRFIDGQAWKTNPPRRQGWIAGIALGLLLGGAVLIAWSLLGQGTIDAEALRELLRRNGLSGASRFFLGKIW